MKLPSDGRRDYQAFLGGYSDDPYGGAVNDIKEET